MPECSSAIGHLQETAALELSHILEAYSTRLQMLLLLVCNFAADCTIHLSVSTLDPSLG